MADRKVLIVAPQHSIKTLSMTIKIATLSIMAHHIVMLTVINADKLFMPSIVTLHVIMLSIMAPFIMPDQMNPYKRGRMSTVDLLMLTSSDKLPFILKILFPFVTKHATLMRR